MAITAPHAGGGSNPQNRSWWRRSTAAARGSRTGPGKTHPIVSCHLRPAKRSSASSRSSGPRGGRLAADVEAELWDDSAVCGAAKNGAAPNPPRQLPGVRAGRLKTQE
jgi:hypothetical protein